MSEKKQLNEEQLEKVNGGKDMGYYLPKNHGIHIGMYAAEAYKNQKVYAVLDLDRENYYWGTLLDSYEDQRAGYTKRTHKIHVEGCNDYWAVSNSYVGKDVDFLGDNFTLFLFN